MRVVWMRSGFFLPDFFCCLSFWRIQSSRSLTESVPTLSLVRWSGMRRSALLIEHLDSAPSRGQRTVLAWIGANHDPLEITIERKAASSRIDIGLDVDGRRRRPFY